MPTLSSAINPQPHPQKMPATAAMPKSILVPIAGISEDKAHLQAALAIARRFLAHLDVVHIRPDAAQIVAAASAATYGSAELVPLLLDQLEKDAETSMAAAQATFTTFVREQSLELRESPGSVDTVTAAWLQQPGYPAERVAQLGRQRDLLVVGHASGWSSGDTGTLETALIKSGRPLLVLPPGVSDVIGHTIVVAWKDSAEAARAVTAAMPFLAGAERIVVIEISEEDADKVRESEGSSERLVASLAWHRIRAEARVIKQGDLSAPDTLLAAARDLGADLVVMGAYGHSRVREMMFGGFTRRILQGADLPVLMFH